MHYHDYLQLDKILNAQDPESVKKGKPAHDESLFIVIHQAYELWFKQLHTEVDSALQLLKNPALNDNSPELQSLVHRLDRCTIILRVLVNQIDIMETMTPSDFLEFRDLLRPASGFQSWQFKELEAKLGLKYAHRHGQEYYTSQLRPEQVELIRKAESEQSILQLLNAWLERMPFLDEEALHCCLQKQFITRRTICRSSFRSDLFRGKYRAYALTPGLSRGTVHYAASGIPALALTLPLAECVIGDRQSVEFVAIPAHEYGATHYWYSDGYGWKYRQRLLERSSG
jgi:tryptophan 2,3-dioxygenase